MFTSILSIVSFISFSQRTISLDEARDYLSGVDGIPEDVTYVKDVGDRLDQFVGVWKGTFGGRTYELHLKKVTSPANEGKALWDQVIGRALVEDSADGTILYNSLNYLDYKTYMQGYYFVSPLAYDLNFTGNTECNDVGDIFIETGKYNPNELIVVFVQDSGLWEINKCPNWQTYKTLFPKQKMKLLKQ